ncbi:hypothetical protein H4R35_000114 [Dimargaris xerosporica]|nr:hypothetical protein H4R35_000114 [Dimargaris xerosporica]
MGASLFQGQLPELRPQLFRIEFSIRLRSDFAQQFTAEQGNIWPGATKDAID